VAETNTFDPIENVQCLKQAGFFLDSADQSE